MQRWIGKKHVICSEHWEGGSRKNTEDIPTIVCPELQLQRFIDSRAKGKNNKELQKKIMCANREKKVQCQRGQKRKAATDRTVVPITKRRRQKSRNQLRVNFLRSKWNSKVWVQKTKLWVQILMSSKERWMICDRGFRYISVNSNRSWCKWNTSRRRGDFRTDVLLQIIPNFSICVG